MADSVNRLGQRVGFAVQNWTPRPLPPSTPMNGRFCRVVPFDLDTHAADLHRANCDDIEGRMWTYLAYGPFTTLDEYLAEARNWKREHWHIHAIVDARSRSATGLANYIAPTNSDPQGRQRRTLRELQTRG
jgi:hypothetical protein